MGNFLDLALEGKNNLWRYLLGIFIIFAVFLGYGLLVPEEVDSWGPVVNYIIQDFSYVFYFLAIVFVVKFLHKRSFHSLITPAKNINWKLMGIGFSVYFILMFLFSLLPQFIIDPNSLAVTDNISSFLILLPFLLILVPIQTTSEELFFRGYLLQGTGFLTRNFFILAVLNGLLFMIPHLSNPEVVDAPLVAIIDWVVFGFFMAYITLESGTLELAISAHAANNLFITVISNYENSVFTTPSFLVTKAGDPNVTMGGDIISGIISVISVIIIPLLFYLLVFKIPRIRRLMVNKQI